MRWAVFKDYRGVAYCEPVNEGLKVFTKFFPARAAVKHTFTRKVKYSAREAETRLHIQFDDAIYSRKDYYESAFQPAPEGYEFAPDRVYLQENYWGPVHVLHFINSDDIGQRLQYALRRIAPDPSLQIKDRIRDAKPNPETDRIIDGICKLVV